MRKQMGVLAGVFCLMLFGTLTGCPGSMGNTNTNTNDNMNTNDNGNTNTNDNTNTNTNDNTNTNTNTNDNMNDNSGGGDATAGQAFYEGNGCVGCHGADASGGVGPNLAGVDAATFLANLDGSDPHPVTVAGVTQADAENLVAYVASLQ